MNTSTPRMNRVLLTGATLAVAALAAGCASGSGTSSASAPAATTSAPATSAPATSAPATTAPAASGSATATSSTGSNPNAAGTPACASMNLRASVGQSNGAGGSVYLPIDFTNIGNSACTLYGYPGVSLAGGSPVAQIGAAADRDPTSHATLVTLQAGQTANALLRVVDALNFPASACKPVPSADLQIYPPGQTTPLFVSYTSTACSDSATHLLTVGVVQLGSGTAS